MPEGFDPDAFARTFGGARATAGGVEFSGDFDVNDIFASLFGGAGGRRHATMGPCAPPPESWRRRDRPAAGDLRGSRPRHQADRAHGRGRHR